jgi:hypothetical protein
MCNDSSLKILNYRSVLKLQCKCWNIILISLQLHKKILSLLKMQMNFFTVSSL